MIAALFVETNGCYFGLPDVDPWDIERDARLYAGPYAVVAHPPCSRWCRLAAVNQARYGQKIGDDDACFESALQSVRTYGGVLEHPAFSIAWPSFGIPKPPSSGGWIKTFCGGWTCHVEQRNYGHRARKATWLYAYGVDPPSLAWGRGPATDVWISTDRPRAELAAMGISQMSSAEAKATPPAFREVLLEIARMA